MKKDNWYHAILHGSIAAMLSKFIFGGLGLFITIAMAVVINIILYKLWENNT